MSSITEPNRSSFATPNAHDGQSTGHLNGLAYGTLDLPILLRLPDVSIIANDTQPHELGKEPDNVAAYNQPEDKDTETIPVASDVAPSADRSVAASEPNMATDSAERQQLRRNVERRKRAARPASGGWLPGAGQIIVAALIAGALLIAIVMLQGKRPSHSVAKDAEHESTGADSIATARALPRQVPASHVAPSRPSNTSANIAVERAMNPAPNPSEEAPEDQNGPVLNSPSVSGTSRFDTARSFPPARATDIPPRVAGERPMSANNRRADEATTARAIPPAYPTTGRASLDLGRDDHSARKIQAWSETVPMGTIRQANAPRESVSNYR